LQSPLDDHRAVVAACQQDTAITEQFHNDHTRSIASAMDGSTRLGRNG
jgi:hypothetical protein